MRISRVRLDAFGCVRDLDTELAPGLNVFVGPNEAGKSHLQGGILALLYGFFEGERRRQAETSVWHHFAPWLDGPYRGQLEYVLANGRRYLVARDFSTPDIVTSVRDQETGADVTAEFGVGRHGRVPFAQHHLGMTKAVFQACAFLSQGEVLNVLGDDEVSPHEIGDTIVSLADTGQRDVSADAALGRLDAVLRERVGGPRSRAAPLPVARHRVEQAEEELATIDRARREIASHASELEDADRRLGELNAEVQRSEYLLRQAQLRDLGARHEQLDGLAARISALGEERVQLEGFAQFPSDERDEILRDRNLVKDLTEALSEQEAAVSAARDALRGLAEERASLVGQAAELTHLADFPLEREASINGLSRVWREAAARATLVESRHELARRDAEAVLEEHAALEAEVGGMTAEELHALTARLAAHPPSWPLRAALTVGRAARAVLSLLWRGLVRAGRWVLARLGRHPEAQGASDQDSLPVVEDAVRLRPEKLTPEAAGALLERHRRFLEIDPLVRALLAEEQALEQAREEVKGAAGALQSALQGLVNDVSDLGRGLESFATKLEGARRLAAIEGRLRGLDAERARHQERVSNWEDDRERRDRTQIRLQQRLVSFGLQGDDLARLVESYEESCRKRARYEQLRSQLAAAEEGQAALLGGRSREELEEEARSLRQRIDVLLRDEPHQEGAQTAERPEALEQRLSIQDEELRRLQVRAEGLRSVVETKMADLRPRADVEEELETHQQEVARLEDFSRALSVAREVIEEAMAEAHRDFAPSVGRFLSEGIHRVTGGRYRRAALDPSTLRVAVEIPELGRLEDSDALSRGTRVAIYLLLRVGLAQHMSSIAEPVPLIMDDPLVDLDDVRLDSFLELALSLAGQVQVLMFTKDEDIADWFGRRCAEDRRHQLHRMPGPPAATHEAV